MCSLKKTLYILCQCTWGILQTFCGAVVFLCCIGRRHYFYHGAIVTEWKLKSGVSLGLFIFTDEEGKLLTHEYGHTVQSLLLGPLYLLVIAFPSMLWAGLPPCKKYRRNNAVSYYSFYTEKWAEHIKNRLK